MSAAQATATPRTTPAYNYAAIVAGVLSIGGAASMAFGKPALAAIFSDPATATELTAAVVGVAGLASAFLPAIVHPATAAAIAAGKP